MKTRKGYKVYEFAYKENGNEKLSNIIDAGTGKTIEQKTGNTLMIRAKNDQGKVRQLCLLVPSDALLCDMIGDINEVIDIFNCITPEVDKRFRRSKPN